MLLRVGLLIVVFMVVAVVSSDAATIVVDEKFNDGTRAVAPVDASETDIDWYLRQSITLSVASDAGGIGSGNALYVDGATDGNGKPVLGILPSTVSLAIGESAILSFDFRFDSSTGPIGATGAGFRFGLLDSNGTQTSADNQSNSDNDRGYSAAIGVGGTNGTAIRDESGANPSALSGNDAVTLTTTGTTGNINDFLAHSATFSITRTASGVDLAFSVFSGTGGTGSVIINGTASDNTGAFTSFNLIAFSQGFPAGGTGGANLDLDYRLDNIKLETVPEPATLAMASFGLMAVGIVSARRRRR